MKKLLGWLDNNILTLISFFLLIFIPLYPKVPLMELIPGYIVRVRLEDFFILAAVVVLIIQVIRKKATLKSIIFWPILIYLGIGLLSCLSAIFITRTVPLEWLHAGKMFIHWLRRVEYFSLFFIFYNGIKSFKNTKIFLILCGVLVCLVSIYGYGQKYLYWPVFSTMNREFSKGVKLYLTEHARVPSTFGGHYDLAAFLVIFLILFAGLFFFMKDIKIKIASLLVFLLGYWLLILSASRTSFIAYVFGLIVMFGISAFKKGWFWSLTRGAIIMIFSFVVMIFFGDLSDRFAHLLKLTEVREKWRLERLVSPLKPPPVSDKFVAFDENIPLVVDITDERPVAIRPGQKGDGQGLPPDVYEKIPDYRESTESGGLDGTAAAKLITVERTFSENAYKYGLSAAIRLDALWPWAIKAFLKNPLLGSGYSTLGKQGTGQFTEAESTDNDYLRALGETGLLGFISFFGIIFIITRSVFKSLKKEKNDLLTIFKISFVSFTLGILVNAIYIDVFEASKLAFIFWAMTGVLLSTLGKKEALLKK
ncbi:MAG TPA: O-antigen ligase family protein [Candidatus Bathyarchaeia archaeon]|nr:O-antigen ligase family protein [Candidatus Bathyarchaeia archaeon]